MAYLYRFFLVFLTMMSLSYFQYVGKAREARERYAQEQEEIKKQADARKVSQYGIDIHNDKRPEIYMVGLQDESTYGDLGSPKISDVYETAYMASGVVGLVGVPVRVSFDEKAQPRITFHYRKDELRGIPERNLIILHEGEDGFYVQVGAEDHDYDSHTISVPIKESGIYLVADIYQWYSAWGADMSAYAYEVDYLTMKSDWERECDTGSILEIADRQWALDNAPVFHVSTPEQLAGVVFYNNAVARYDVESVELQVYLEADVDLRGYLWTPMGWSGPGNNQFNGLFDGQGHTISNMTIIQPNMSHVAFIGYSTGSVVKNVTFKDAYVVGGRYTGIVGGEIYISREWENVNVSGVIEDAKGEIGSIIGREAALHFKNCKADVTYRDADGNERPLEYFSHRLEVVATTPATEDFKIVKEKDGSITRSEAEGTFRNLCWHLDVDGVLILQRAAEDEINFNAMQFFQQYLGSKKKCTIWLEAFTGETYTRVSNIIEYK